ncbi:hypothetical protein VCEC0051_003448B, partial [Vibrio cholerae O1 str. EC-0051]
FAPDVLNVENTNFSEN